MTDKLNNLSDWLRNNRLKEEASLLSDILLKSGELLPELPEFTEEERLSVPGLTEEERLSVPVSDESIKTLFTAEEQGLSSEESLEHNVLFEGKVLKKGHSGGLPDAFIKRIQSLLEKHGYALAGHGADGIFGEETEKAILEFQRNNKNGGLAESGEIDKATLLALKSTTAIRRTPSEIGAPAKAQKINRSKEPHIPDNFAQYGNVMKGAVLGRSGNGSGKIESDRAMRELAFLYDVKGVRTIFSMAQCNKVAGFIERFKEERPNIKLKQICRKIKYSKDPSSNRDIHEEVASLIQSGEKFYIHCYYGFHRTGTALVGGWIKTGLSFDEAFARAGISSNIGRWSGSPSQTNLLTQLRRLSEETSNADSPPNKPPKKVAGGRANLANMSSQTRNNLYKLTQAEVGSQGARAQQAFMETVSNRSAIQGKTIEFTVTNRRYYQPIMGEGKSIDTLRPVSDKTRAKYDKILDKVIGGSNITNGATHNASAGVARSVNKGGYNSKISSIIVIGGETFYSKTYEQRKIKRLDFSDTSDLSIKPSGQSDIPPPRRPNSSGEYILPKVSFVSVPAVSAANLAIKESREAWDNGNFGEKDPRAEAPIQKYYAYTSKHNGWKNNIDRWGTGRRGPGSKHEGKRQLNPVRERDKNGTAINWYAWSAVYVSWVMKQYDGEGATWFASEGHPLYIRSYKNKRKKIERNPKDHIGKMYYIWFTREEMNKYGMKPEPGDVIGRGSHCDIYIGGNQIIGGNTSAKNKDTGNKKKFGGGTSGAKPLVWKSGFGIIKRVRITGPGSNNMLVA